jgi:hypothetical protein
VPGIFLSRDTGVNENNRSNMVREKGTTFAVPRPLPGLVRSLTVCGEFSLRLEGQPVSVRGCGCLINHVASHHSLQHLDVRDVFGRNLKRIAIEHDEIGEFSGFE